MSVYACLSVCHALILEITDDLGLNLVRPHVVRLGDIPVYSHDRGICQ